MRDGIPEALKVCCRATVKPKPNAELAVEAKFPSVVVGDQADAPLLGGLEEEG
ncbi:hypothetical protein SH449x_003388 [Pirellulaceae bacterium SH449]